jgi:hypothetical protein
MRRLMIEDDSNNDEVVKIPRSRLLDEVPLPSEVIMIRYCSQEFAYRGYFLSSAYDWVVGMNSAGACVLVPLKKV